MSRFVSNAVLTMVRWVTMRRFLRCQTWSQAVSAVGLFLLFELFVIVAYLNLTPIPSSSVPRRKLIISKQHAGQEDDCDTRLRELTTLFRSDRLLTSDDLMMMSTCPGRDYSKLHVAGYVVVSNKLKSDRIGEIMTADLKIEWRQDMKGFDLFSHEEICKSRCFSYGMPFVIIPDKSHWCGCNETFDDDLLEQNLSIKHPDESIVFKVIRFEKNPGFRKYEKIPELPAQINRNANVKIMFLLTLNGRNVEQCSLLLSLIYSQYHVYLVHVDRRQDYLYGMLRKRWASLPNVHFMEDRHAPIWGGASLLDQVFAAFLFATTSQMPHWDFIINLSESDLPIKPIIELESFFEENLGVDFLETHVGSTHEFVRKQGINMAFFECGNFMHQIKRNVDGVSDDRYLPIGIRWFGSSDWFALSRKTIDRIVSNIKAPGSDLLFDKLVRYLRYALLPVEVFFQTYLMNSERCERGLVNSNTKFINWNRKRGCSCGLPTVHWCGCSPMTMTLAQWHEVQSIALKSKSNTQRFAGIFFSRKFDVSQSPAVVDEIASEIVKSQSPPPALTKQPIGTFSDKFIINIYDAYYDDAQTLLKYPLKQYVYLLNAMYNPFMLSNCSPQLQLKSITQVFVDGDARSLVIEATIAKKTSAVLTLQFLQQRLLCNDDVDDLARRCNLVERLDVGTNLNAKELLFNERFPIVTTNSIWRTSVFLAVFNEAALRQLSMDIDIPRDRLRFSFILRRYGHMDENVGNEDDAIRSKSTFTLPEMTMLKESMFWLTFNVGNDKRLPPEFSTTNVAQGEYLLELWSMDLDGWLAKRHIYVLDDSQGKSDVDSSMKKFWRVSAVCADNDNNLEHQLKDCFAKDVSFAC